MNTVSTVGWRIVVERIVAKMRQKTDANDVDTGLPGDQVKAELIGRKIAVQIVDEVFNEVIGEANYTKKRTTDYS